CWLPNFAFSYLAAQKRRIRRNANLAHVRGWINCSEPIRETSFAAFNEAFADLGVRREHCKGSYAMAENVFAVTQSPLIGEANTFKRDALAVARPGHDQTSYHIQGDVYVSSGRCLPGTAVRIREADGRICGDDKAGTIEIKGDCLFSGYWGSAGFQTQAFTADGWYATGDYGFTHQGEVYVIGRVKDMIISSGVNIFPEDIEALLNGIDGIYPVRVVAFGIDDQNQGTEGVAVVAEMRNEFDKAAAELLTKEIRSQVAATFGIALRHVRVTPKQWIVKSTAGKISRRETRMRYL